MVIPIVVVPYDPDWPAQFDAEQRAIREALGEIVLEIHHIGSTSVPGLAAKPLIDMLPVVTDLALLDVKSAAMENLGYEVMGEFGIPGRRYFRKENAQSIRTHHVHAFERGCDEIERHLRFRDFLRAHPEWAAAYAALKYDVASRTSDIEGYMDGKDAFIKRAEQLALTWRQTGQPAPAPTPGE